MKEQLKKFAKKNKLNNVKFLPFKNQKDLAKIYQTSDVFIMPPKA